MEPSPHFIPKEFGFFIIINIIFKNNYTFIIIKRKAKFGKTHKLISDPADPENLIMMHKRMTRILKIRVLLKKNFLIKLTHLYYIRLR
jgi:hypothetical protein